MLNPISKIKHHEIYLTQNHFSLNGVLIIEIIAKPKTICYNLLLALTLSH